MEVDIIFFILLLSQQYDDSNDVDCNDDDSKTTSSILVISQFYSDHCIKEVEKDKVTTNQSTTTNKEKN